jgi:hypothetical protein
LEFHPSLQCLSFYQLILSSLGLPTFELRLQENEGRV